MKKYELKIITSPYQTVYDFHLPKDIETCFYVEVLGDIFIESINLMFKDHKSVHYDHIKIEWWMENGCVDICPALESNSYGIAVSKLQIVFPLLAHSYEELTSGGYSEEIVEEELFYLINKTTPCILSALFEINLAKRVYDIFMTNITKFKIYNMDAPRPFCVFFLDHNDCEN